MSTKVFRVYDNTPDEFQMDFTVVIDKEGRRTRFYDLTVNQIYDVLKSAQCFATIDSNLMLSDYRVLYDSE